jgi:putative ABC transport system permease protein
MTGWRALLRLAVRDARRDRWRTVLIVVMIALPVAGLAGLIGVIDTGAASPEDRARDQLGTADLRLAPDDPGMAPDLAALRAVLPDGATVQVQRSTSDHLLHDGAVIAVGVTDDAPLPGTLLEPRHRMLTGVAPVRTEQVAVHEQTAAAHGIAVGDRVALESLGEVEVVGTIRRLEALWSDGFVVAPGTLPEHAEHTYVDAVYVAVPDGMAELARRRVDELYPPDTAAGYWISTRDEVLALRFTDDGRFAATIIGGLGAVEAALIAGAAFAVSVRRRQRELGLLAAVGGSPRMLRQVVRLTGLAAGAAGACLGLVLALVAVLVLAGTPWIDVWFSREVAGPRIDAAWFLGVAALGVASAVVGAWWPSRTVARLPVTVALSGRRPVTTPPRRGVLAGSALIAAGLLILGSVALADRSSQPLPYLLGSVLLVLGVGLLSPAVLERLARLAPRLPLGPRLAVRDAARFRTRNGPIVTAAMAGLAATITVTAVLGSTDRQGELTYRPSLAENQVVVHGPDAERVATALAGATGGRTGGYVTIDLDVVLVGGSDPNGWAAVATPDLVAALAGDDAVSAFRDGAVIVLGREATAVGIAPFGSWTGDGPEVVAELPAVAFPHQGGEDPATASHVRWATSSLPDVLLPAAPLEELVAGGALEVTVPEVGSGSHLVVLPGPLDAATADLARSLARNAGEAFIEVEEGYVSSYRAAIVAATVGGALAGLVLVAIAVALASAEARADARTLVAVGASRRTRRTLAAGRAALLSGVAGLLAVPVGLVPAAALLTRLRYSGVALTLPWLPMLVIVVVVPVVAMLGAALAASREPTSAVRAAA